VLLNPARLTRGIRCPIGSEEWRKSRHRCTRRVDFGWSLIRQVFSLAGDEPVKQPRSYRRRRLLGVLRSGGALRASVFGACGSLLLQALILTLHVPQAYSSVNDIDTWPSASICHVDVVPADIPADRGNDHPGKKAPTRIPPACPICVSIHAAGSYLQPTLIALPLFRRAGALHFPSGDAASAAAPYRTPAQARAPPAKT
jgi:hypothetical protein